MVSVDGGVVVRKWERAAESLDVAGIALVFVGTIGLIFAVVAGMSVLARAGEEGGFEGFAEHIVLLNGGVGAFAILALLAIGAGLAARGLALVAELMMLEIEDEA